MTPGGTPSTKQPDSLASWWMVAAKFGTESPSFGSVLAISSVGAREERDVLRLAVLLSHQVPEQVRALPRLGGLTGTFLDVLLGSRGKPLMVQSALLSEVISMARVTFNELVLTWALLERGRYLGIAGSGRSSAQDLREALSLADRLSLPVVKIKSWYYLGLIYAQDGRVAEFITHMERAAALGRACNLHYIEALCRCNIADGLIRLGRFDEAHQIYADVYAITHKTEGMQYVEAVVLAGQSMLRIQGGDVVGGLEDFRSANETIQSFSVSFRSAWNTLGVAMLLLRSGDHTRAMLLGQRARKTARDKGFNHLEIRILEFLSQVAEAQGDLPTALNHARAAIRLERGKLDGLLAEAKRASEESQETFLALKRVVSERQRRQETSKALRAALREESRLRLIVEASSRTDPLTGIHNRHAYEVDIKRILADAARTTRSVALFVVDIDHFKSFNDRFGHAIGDQVLTEVAKQLASSVRAADLVARWGGEEFAVAAPGADAHGAARLGETLRAAIADTSFATDVGPLKVTVSIGAAIHTPQDTDVQKTFQRADLALYQAKNNGRDQVCVDARAAGPLMSPSDARAASAPEAPGPPGR